MNICNIDNCTNKVVSFGLCDKHRKRRDAHGDPLKVLRGVTLSKHYFWKQVNKTDTCWLWTGSTTKYGYGKFGYKYKRIGAHRMSLLLSGIKLEKGLVVDHLCRNPLCVNPSHLEQVTHKENALRSTRYHPELKNVGSYDWSKLKEYRAKKAAQSRINHLREEAKTNL